MDVEGYTKDTDPENRIWQWGTQGLTIGAKRNELIEFARGEIICHFDDDDWYAPDYISKAVSHLIQSGGKITGLDEAYFYRPGDNRMWLFKKAFKHAYVIGSGMCYYRSEWEKRKFVNKNSGEDLEFQVNPGQIKPHGYIDGFMAMIHKRNTASHKQLGQMTPVNPEIAESILGEDYNLYI